MKAASLAAMLGLGAPAARAQAPRPSVTLTREGGVFRLRAGFTVDAPESVVWGVLTDYNGMTRFLSNLKRSRVLKRTDTGALIEQIGAARLMLFSRRVKLTLDVAEKPPQRIEFRDVGGGEFEEYDGAWTLQPAAGGTEVSYELFAEMTPSLVPRAVARRVLETSVHRQLDELAAEMVRRAASAAPRGPARP